MNIENHIYRKAADRFNRVVNIFSSMEKALWDFGGGESLTSKELHTVAAVGEFPLITVTRLAKHMGVTKSASSQLVGKLEKKGYIQKLKRTDNNLEIHLALSDKGQKACAWHDGFHGMLEEKIIDEITPEQAEVFNEVLKKIESITSHYPSAENPVSNSLGHKLIIKLKEKNP